jgi:hypothetical protein
MTDPLDRLAPALAWEPDWADVLRRGGERASRRAHVSRRRLAIALALVVAAVVPLVAVGADGHWWFLDSPESPAPTTAPVVVHQGGWSGHPWELVAYTSGAGDLCYSIGPRGSGRGRGVGAAMTCARIEAGTNTTISGLGGAGGGLPDHIGGAVVGSAATVEIMLTTGEALRVPTFAGPESLGDLRFFASELPHRRFVPGERIVARLVGYDAGGKIVACSSWSDNGESSLADCR